MNAWCAKFQNAGALSGALRQVPQLAAAVRALSSTAAASSSAASSACTVIRREVGNGGQQQQQHYALLKLHKPPVNSLNLEAIDELNDQVARLESDPQLAGVILTSDVRGVFSAGVDIMEMYKCDVKRLARFWTSVQELWLRLYGSRKVYVAAINGHALAFGCVLAMSCDYRLMSRDDKYKIGLNATLLGINAPSWFKDTMVNTMGYRASEVALQLGKRMSASEALRVKLVDELVDEAALLQQADKCLRQWIAIPKHAREGTKLAMREATLKKLRSQRDADLRAFIESTTDPALQANLHAYLESLKVNKQTSMK